MKGLTTGTLHGKLGIRAGNTGPDQPRRRRRARRAPDRRGGRGLPDRDERDRPGPLHGRRGRGRARPGVPRRVASATPTSAQTFGEEIGRHQLVKQMIAKMVAGTEMGRLLVWRAGWLKNQGLRNTRETSLAKWHATEHAVQSALDAIQVHGANGYSNEFPVERYLRNSKAAVIYEGTSQLHTLIQADYALGYREDRPLRCEPWPAPGLGAARERLRPALGRCRHRGPGPRPSSRRSPSSPRRSSAAAPSAGRGSPPRRSSAAADPAQVAPAPARPAADRVARREPRAHRHGRPRSATCRRPTASATSWAGATSPLALRRSAFQALRKLLTFLAYADPGRRARRNPLLRRDRLPAGRPAGDRRS